MAGELGKDGEYEGRWKKQKGVPYNHCTGEARSDKVSERHTLLKGS